MFSQKRMRYLLVGGANTMVGYMIGIFIYKAMSNSFGIVSIGIISNVLSITFSFVAYKIFVFRTKGAWFTEYLKAYLLYGGMALIGIFLLWLFVENMRISIWVAQALIIGLTFIISYVGHSRFTFHRNEIS
jgi:putative flippase GtrA